MKLKPKLLLAALLALPSCAGCAVGLPHGPLEPSITADWVSYLNENWLGARTCDAACCCDEIAAQHAEPTLIAAPELASASPCPLPGACVLRRGCPLEQGMDFAPPYVDPGPPGRFLPVPVRPVFSPQPTDPRLFYPPGQP